MNIWSAKSKGQLKIWAKLLAILLTISMCFTLNPIGKNTKAWASTSSNDTEQGQADEQTSDDTQSDDSDVIESDEQSDTQEATYAEETSDSQVEAASEDVEDVDEDTILTDDDLYSDDSISQEDLLAIYEAENSSSTDSSTSNNGEFYVDGVNIYDSENSNVSDKKDSETSKTPENTQYSYEVGDNASELGSYEPLNVEYSYHFTDDKTGVIIDGIKTIKDDKSASNDDEKEEAKEPTLIIPCKIKYNVDKKVEEASKDIAGDNPFVSSDDVNAELYSFFGSSNTQTTDYTSDTYVSVPVYGISDNAFQGRDEFTQVAFACPSDISLAYYEGVAIGENAFNKCSNLKKIVCSRDVTIGNSSFSECSNLERAFFGKNIYKVGDKAFENCSSLTSVSWSNCYINDYAEHDANFNNDEYNKFGEYVFRGCQKLETIYIPNSIKKVELCALAECDYLKEAVIPPSCTWISSWVFGPSRYSADNKLSRIVVLSENATFSTEAFQDINKYNNISKIYTMNGTPFMEAAIKAQLPVTFDGAIVSAAQQMYVKGQEQEKTNDVLTNDSRTHHAVSDSRGSGTKDDPFVIRNATELRAFSNIVNSGMYDACAVLANDIEFTSDTDGSSISKNNWVSIGKDHAWSGTFDGNGYTVKNVSQDKTLTISLDGVDIATQIGGGIASGIIIAKVAKAFSWTNPVAFAVDTAVNAAFFVTSYFVRNYAKMHTDEPVGFVRKASNNFEIKNLDLYLDHIYGASKEVGGLVSIVEGDGTITNTNISGELKATDIKKSCYCGGMVGKQTSGNLKITDSLNATDISFTNEAERCAGGFVARSEGSVDFNGDTNSGSSIAPGASTSEFLWDAIFFAVTEVLSGLSYIGASKEAKNAAKAEKTAPDPVTLPAGNTDVQNESLLKNAIKDADQQSCREAVEANAGRLKYATQDRTGYDKSLIKKDLESGQLEYPSSYKNELLERQIFPDMYKEESSQLRGEFSQLVNKAQELDNEFKGEVASFTDGIAPHPLARDEKIGYLNLAISDNGYAKLKPWSASVNPKEMVEAVSTIDFQKCMTKIATGSDKNIIYGSFKYSDGKYWFKSAKEGSKFVEIKDPLEVIATKSTKQNQATMNALKEVQERSIIARGVYVDAPLEQRVIVEYKGVKYSVKKSTLGVHDALMAAEQNAKLVEKSSTFQTLKALYKECGLEDPFFTNRADNYALKICNQYDLDMVNAVNRNVWPSIMADAAKSAKNWHRISIFLRCFSRLGYSHSVYPDVHEIIETVKQENKKANNIDDDSSNLQTYTSVGNSLQVSNSQDYSEKDYGYKNTISYTSTNDTSSVEDFCKTFTLGSINDGDNRTNVATRTTVQTSDDADYYFRQLEESNRNVDSKYGDHSADFGSMHGAAGGFVGEAAGSNNIVSFDNCVSAGNTIAGVISGGFVGETQGSTVNFAGCTASPASNVATSDSGKASLFSSKPSAAGFIGKTNDGSINVFGSTSGGTVTSNSKAASFIATISGRTDTTVNASASSGFSYAARSNGGVSGFFTDVSGSAKVELANSYCDGVVAGTTSNKGYFSASSSNNLDISNCYYYSDTYIFGSNKYATSYASNTASCQSTDQVTCYSDPTMMKSGEICYKLNSGIGENVFGQNFGWYPVKVENANGVSWQYAKKHERCVPFFGMNVFGYTETNTSNATTSDNASVAADENSNSSSSGSTSVSTTVSNDGSKKIETTNEYSNYPLSFLQNGELKFVDVQVDESIIGEFTSRTYIKSGESQDFQFVGINGSTIAQVLYDGYDVTKSLKYNQDTGSYVFSVPNISANHKLVVKSKIANSDIAPTIENGTLYICNLNNWIWLYKHMDNANGELNEVKKVSLLTDLNLSSIFTIYGKDWAGLGTDAKPFTYEFEGNGYTISNVNNVPIFNVTSDVNIKNLKVDGVQTSKAGLINKALGNSQITNVYVTGAAHCEAAFIHDAANTTFTGCWADDCSIAPTSDNSTAGTFIARTFENVKIAVNKCSINMTTSYNRVESSCGGVIGTLGKSTSFEMNESSVTVDITQEYLCRKPKYTSTNGVSGVIGHTTNTTNNEADENYIAISNCYIGGSLESNSPVAVGVCFTDAKKGSYVRNTYLDFSKIKWQDDDEISWFWLYGFQPSDGFSNNYCVKFDKYNAAAVSSKKDERSLFLDKGYKTKSISTADAATKTDQDKDCAFSQSDVISGKITYLLNNSSSQNVLFAQHVDDEGVSLPNKPSLKLKFAFDVPYTIVSYNGNGADYSVDGITPQIFEKDATQQLRSNTFTREGYRFVGWATSPNGKVEYTDQQQIKNPGKAGDKITLYAVWQLTVGPLNGSNEASSNDNTDQVSENSETTDSDSFVTKAYADEAEEYEEASDDNGDDSGDSKEETHDGTVYEYTDSNTGQTYYSNLTDDKCHIIKFSYDTNAIVTSVGETRVAFTDNDSPAIMIEPKIGYLLSNVDVDIQYTNENNAFEHQTYPMLTFGEHASVLQIKNMHCNVVVKIIAKVIGEEKPEGLGTQDSPYLIKNVNQLIWIRNLVNAGKAPAGINVRLAANIDASSVDWKSIGTHDHPFNGTFIGEFVDGIGKHTSYSITGLRGESLFGETSGNTTISSIAFNAQDVYGSLVNRTGGNTVVKDITVSGSFNNANGKYVAAAIVGEAYGNTEITNCQVSASVTLAFEVTEYGNYTKSLTNGIGSIVGIVSGNRCSITNCTSRGLISTDITDKGQKQAIKIGGLVGFVNPRVNNAVYTIDKCANYCTFNTGSNGEVANSHGGLVGEYCPTYLSASQSGEIGENCQFTMSSSQNFSNVVGEKSGYSGGVIGYVLFHKENIHRGIQQGHVTITYCGNSGQIDGTDYVGGVIGYAVGDFDYSKCDFLDVNNCFSYATALASNQNKHLGEFAGNIYGFDDGTECKFSNCYVADIEYINVTGDKKNVSKIAKFDDFKSGQVVNLLNGGWDVSEIGKFGQAIDCLQRNKEEFPRVMLTQDDLDQITVHKFYAERRMQWPAPYYSNYDKSQIAWITVQAADGQSNDLHASVDKNILPVGAEAKINVNSTNGGLVNAIAFSVDGSQDKTVTSDKPSFAYSYTYKIDKAGDIDVVCSIKDIDTVPNKDANGNYLVTSTSELLWVVEQVNVHHNNKINFVLAADLDLKDIDFIPIGTSESPFAGTFSAQKPGTAGTAISDFYQIANLDSTKYGDYAGGLFGYCSGANISSLNLTNVTSRGAGLVYSANECSVSKVFVSGKVDSYHSDEQKVNISSGIVGFSRANNIQSCQSAAKCQSMVDTEANIAGGVVGALCDDGNSIINCINRGTINTASSKNENSYSGGIVGLVYADMFSTNNTEQCAAFIYGCSNKSYIYGQDSIGGGVIGGIDCTNTTAHKDIVLKNCTNEGIVGSIDSRLRVAGGIIGQMDSNTAASPYSVSMQSCANYSLIAADTLKGNAYSGGLIGVAAKYDSINAYNSFSYVTKINCEFSKGNSGLLVGKEEEKNKAITLNNFYYNSYKELSVCGKSAGDAISGSFATLQDADFQNGNVLTMLNSGGFKNTDINYQQISYKMQNQNDKVVLLNNSTVFTLSSTKIDWEPSGQGSASYPYVISNEAQLMYIAYCINHNIQTDKHFANSVIKVTKDLDLSCLIDYKPFNFSGQFTGQEDSANGQVSYNTIKVFNVPIFNHCENAKISGINITGNVNWGVSLVCNEAKSSDFSAIKFSDAHLGQGTDNMCVGLLTAAAHDNVYISNCSVDNQSTVTCNCTSGAYGMLVGVIDGKDSTIKSCLVEGKLIADKAKQQETYAGGFIGVVEDANNVTIEECINQADITTTSYNGGFIGAIKHVSDKVFMAMHGTALTANQEGAINLKSCQNKGLASGKNSISGGFVGGYLNTNCRQMLNMVKCVNSAAKVGNDNQSVGSHYAGGFFGACDTLQGRVTMENSYTVANCIAANGAKDDYAGGFVGCINNIRYDSSETNKGFQLRSSYVYAKQVKASGAAGSFGGCINTPKGGSNSYTPIVGCPSKSYVLKQSGLNLKGTGSLNDFQWQTGHLDDASQEEFNNGKVAHLLGSNWLQTLDKFDTYKVKNEYPVLTNAEKVYGTDSDQYGYHRFTNYDSSQIHIKTAQDLVDLQKKYSSYSKEQAKRYTYVLDNDIDMAGINWDTSLGVKDKEFVSEFDGNGYSINNLTGKSLFGNCDNAIIKNVAFHNVNCETAPVVTYGVRTTQIISVTTDGSVHSVDGSVGGIAGALYGKYSIIKDCVSRCDIKVSNDTKTTSIEDDLGEDALNSIYDELGSNDLSTVNRGDMWTSVCAGGIVGELGLAARLEKCENYGAVNAEGVYQFGSSLGGLIGYVPPQSDWCNIINNGYNEGKISGGEQAGGLIGSLGLGSNIGSRYDNTSVVVNNVVNWGEVTGASYNSSAFGCVAYGNHISIDSAILTSKKISGNNASVVCSDLNGSLSIGSVKTGEHKIQDVINNGWGKVKGEVDIVEDTTVTDSLDNNCDAGKRSVVNIDFESTDNGKMTVNGVMSTDQNTKSVTVPANSTVTLTFQPDEGMETDTLVINDTTIYLDGTNQYKLAVTDQNVKASVFYKENRETTKIQSSNGDIAYNLKSENKTFTKWTSTNNELPSTSGNYYLTSDVNLSGTWVIKKGTNISLSLEGHMIKELAKDVPVIQVEEGASLEIYDLNNGGRTYYFTDNVDAKGNTVGAWKLVGSSATGAKPANVDDNHVVKGGIITGATGNGCGIKVDANGSVIVHQANIVGNEGNSSAGGVDNHGSFDLRHGCIIGNFGTYVGGVVNHTNGTFTNRDEIEYNTGVQDVGGVRNIGQYNVEGFSKLSFNTLAKTKQPADFSIVAAINNTADNQGDKVTILSRVNFVGSVYCLTNCYMSVDDASLNILGWKLTSNYSAFNKIYYGAVDPFVLDKSGYHLQIKDGELAIEKN